MAGLDIRETGSLHCCIKTIDPAYDGLISDTLRCVHKDGRCISGSVGPARISELQAEANDAGDGTMLSLFTINQRFAAVLCHPELKDDSQVPWDELQEQYPHLKCLMEVAALHAISHRFKTVAANEGPGSVALRSDEALAQLRKNPSAGIEDVVSLMNI